MRSQALLLVMMVALSTAILAPRSAQADSSKLHKVDLDVSNTVIIRGDLGQLGWYYYMDATACVCWVGGKTGSDNSSTAAAFDCQRLKAHPAMAEYLADCGKESAPSPAPKEEHKP